MYVSCHCGCKVVRLARVRWCCAVRVGSSVVSVMTAPQVGRYRVRIPVSARVLSVLQIIQTVSKTHPASYSVGVGGFARCVSQTGREVYHSPLTSAEVKNDCSYRHMPSRSGQIQLYIHLRVQRHSSLSFRGIRNVIFQARHSRITTDNAGIT
jgi:hypothetical protein